MIANVTHTSKSSTWLFIPTPRPHARMRLFCFPYAGGGTSIYREWGAKLPPEIEMCAVRLPGREIRHAEPSVRHIGSLVSQVADGLKPHLDRPFACFGHSMGALVVFELARKLRHDGLPMPIHLFVSGRHAPHVPGRSYKTPRHTLPDAEFVAELRRLQGTPEEILALPELLELLLPMLRADFEAIDTHEYREAEPLECPITALGGLEDGEAPRDSIAAWQMHTRSRFSMHMLPGNHFFIHPLQDSVLQLIAQELQIVPRFNI